MTQQSLAEALGVSFQQVQKYEKGLNRISAGRLRQICDALGVPVDRIVGKAEPTPAHSGSLDRIQRFLATRDGMALMMAFHSIDDQNVRRELITLVRRIADAEIGRRDARPERKT